MPCAGGAVNLQLVETRRAHTEVGAEGEKQTLKLDQETPVDMEAPPPHCRIQHPGKEPWRVALYPCSQYVYQKLLSKTPKGPKTQIKNFNSTDVVGPYGP